MNAYATALLERQQIIESNLNDFHIILSKARKGNMGLTLEEDKTLEWCKAQANHILWFRELQKVNQALNKIRRCVGYENVNGKRIAVYKYKD